VDLRLLRSFLEVAERLHFGHAAHQLHISQPTLSHQIRRLEAFVGAPLFDRTSRTVRLTEAGHALVPEARRLMIDFERAMAQTRNAASGGTGHLSIASIGAGLNGLVPLIVGRLRDRVPGVAVQIAQMSTPELLSHLRMRELDFGIVRSADQAAGVRIETLIDEPMVAVLPADHRLAHKDAVFAADMRDEDFVLWPRTANPRFHDQVLELCRAEGFAPRVVMEGADIETQLGLVSAGIGVSMQPASFANLGRHGVVWRPLRGDTPTSPLQMAWCEPVRTPLIDMVGEIARELGKAWTLPLSNP
jgi:DNA-binding transcriptional LysR family regulator